MGLVATVRDSEITALPRLFFGSFAMTKSLGASHPAPDEFCDLVIRHGPPFPEPKFWISLALMLCLVLLLVCFGLH